MRSRLLTPVIAAFNAGGLGECLHRHAGADRDAREDIKMTDDRQTSSDLRPVQHPIIARSAIPETIWQFFILGGGVAVLEWFGVRFEFTLLALLVLGFTLNTMNVMAATMSQNVHLAEIRDLLLKQVQE